MPQSEENRARPRSGRALIIIAAALLCAAVLQPNLAYAAPHGGGGFHGGDFTPAGSVGADLAASTGAHFTPAGFMAVGFMTEGWVDFTVAVSVAPSPACIIVWDIQMAATGTMAGTTDATAGGGVATGWDGPTTRIPGGVTQTTETTTTTSLTLPRPGTIAPIRLAITRM